MSAHLTSMQWASCVVLLQDTYTHHGKAVMNNYAHSHWQQRSNTTPSQEGYMRAKGDIKGPPRVGGAIGVSPYMNPSKVAMMHKHASSKK